MSLVTAKLAAKLIESALLIARCARGEFASRREIDIAVARTPKNIIMKKTGKEVIR